MNKMHTANLLSIGDELLIGQVINTNVAWLSAQLHEAGFRIHLHISVADTTEDIIQGLSRVSAGADLVLVTGGLGPTKDDLTIDAIAEFFNDEIAFHEETFTRLTTTMTRFGRDVKANQRHQCMLPSRAEVFNNDMGTAPGMYFEEGEKRYFFMPGVPFEMKHLFSDRLMPRLYADGWIQNHIQTTTILTAGIGEATLEQQISDIVDSFPTGLGISYLPGKAQVRLRLTAHHLPDSVVADYRDKLVKRLGTGVFGYETDTLEQVIGRILKSNGWTVGCAESCTGGNVSAMITSVPGASAYFKGSIISYANEIKNGVLGVSTETLEQHGAVSKACVREMVAGALRVLEVDVVVAISGVAGPDGGSEDKPVGTVFIGVGDRNEIKVKRLNATKSRTINIDYFSSFALNLLRLFLMGKGAG